MTKAEQSTLIVRRASAIKGALESLLRQSGVGQADKAEITHAMLCVESVITEHRAKLGFIPPRRRPLARAN